MYLIRLAFAAVAVGPEAKRTRRAGWLLSGGERTSVSAGNEALATIPRRPRASNLLFLSTLPPLLSCSRLLRLSRPSSLSPSRMKIVFISHLSRARVNITSECTHLPLRAVTSEIHDAEKSLCSRCYPQHTWPRLNVLTLVNFELSNKKL